MTKRVNWLPNERVDLLDMTDGTTGVAVGVSTQFVQRMVLDHFARIANGFRVEIANQGTSPGQFSVWNGVAFNRFGQILQNEDEENTSRSVTLLANGQYFVEVVFAAPASDTDARAFWDPTVDNGTDPSGDQREPGKEFGQNVATRLSPDWQVVTPVSTTGFEITTNANSLKVPVAVIQVLGGVITGGSTLVARTTLETPAGIGLTAIKVFDSRLFPDTFNATLGAEAITITANDRVNGILTLGGALVGAHVPGERLVITGVGLTQFLVEASTQVFPLPTSGTQDARPRMFHGNPDRGNALAQDPGAATGRSSVQLQTLKDQVDFLSAQIREMRFGAERTADVGILAPPASYPATPNYWDLSGGVTGARCNSVSIGDGVNSFGDFNLNKFSDATALFNAAIAALPSPGGGTIFVKRAPSYNFTGGASVIGGSRSVRIIAELPGTVLHAEGATAVFSLQASTLELVGFNVVRDGGATCAAVINFDTVALVPSSLLTSNCVIEGVNTATVSILTNSTFVRTTFVSNGGNHIGFRGDTAHSHFNNCTFDGSADGNAATRCMVLGVHGTTSTVFTNCLFTGGNGAGQAIDLTDTTDVKFNRCEFAFVPFQQRAILATSGHSERLTIEDCFCAEQSGLMFADDITDLTVRNCKLINISNGGFQGLHITNGTNIDIDNCRFFQNGVTGAISNMIMLDIIQGLHIKDCKFEQADCCIWIDNAEEVFIGDNEFTVPGGAFGRYFLNSTASLTNAIVRDNHIFGLNDTSAGELMPIKIRGVCFNTKILGNTISTIGVGGSNCTNGVISVRPSAGNGDDIHICNNEIDTITNLVAGSCIEVWTSARRITIANNIVLPLATNQTGIQVYDNAQNNAIQEIIITGNTVGHQSTGNSCSAGIVVTMTSSASLNEGLVVVSSNVIRGWDFNSVGIQVIGSASLATAATVANNVLQNAAAATLIAIAVNFLRTAVVIGNSMDLTDTGNLTTKVGIGAFSCQTITVTGNACRVGHQDGNTFRIDTCLRGAISGNVIECAGVSVSATGINVINVSPQMMVSGNSIWGFAGGGAGALAGANQVPVARSNVDNNSATAPGALNDVGLNLRM